MLTADPALKVKRGNGAYLELEDGRRLVDCISSWWVTLHGHAQPEIARAIYEQAQVLEQVIFAGFTHQPAEDLADALLQRLPENLKHIFFSDNGSTAVEVSLKMAFQYWRNRGEKRSKFMAFEGGYHGDTVGAMSIGRGSPFWNKFEPLLFSIDVVPYPATFEADPSVEEKEQLSLGAIENLLRNNAGDYAAICIEPLVQGAAGMRCCRPEFLQALRKLASKHDVLLIFDEVMTGFGRTGDFFASTKSGVAPDLICLSKGITGGFLPLSVTVCSSEIFERFLSSESDKTFYHGHSYTANPIACAAAVCSWRLLNQNRHLFADMELSHRRLAAEKLGDHRLLKNQRFCGTIFAAEVVAGESDGYFNEVALIMKRRFIEKGFLIRPLGNTIYLMPPYCIDAQCLASVYEAISEVLNELS